MITLETLFAQVGFTPNPNQRRAIDHIHGPLFLVAGPGSGKTRVLLWRTLNLIVFHGVKPEEIFLATFTEKAAQQLKDGLLSLLGLVTNLTGVPYDLSKMYMGTVHSLCNRILTDRAFSPDRTRRDAPRILDALEQYFFLASPRFWRAVVREVNWEGELEDLRDSINTRFADSQYPQTGKHLTVQNLQSLFNRLSEEHLDPDTLREMLENGTLSLGTLERCNAEQMIFLLRLYGVYRRELGGAADLSLLQSCAFETVNALTGPLPFKHVIVDEYQDTNAIQEKLYFALAAHTHLCVVGDDEQALYRFRGATVENFVQFPERCLSRLGCSPTRIPLSINYRSRSEVVGFYTRFMDSPDWSRPQGGSYRIEDKGITAHSGDTGAAIVTATGGPEEVAQSIAELVSHLLRQGKVADPNQIAFLFPYLKGAVAVKRMQAALEKQGLKVYAPRASRFLEGEEPTAVVGLLLKILGRPPRSMDFDGGQYREYHDWLDLCLEKAAELLSEDEQLSTFVKARKAEIAEASKDFVALSELLTRQGLAPTDLYDPGLHKRSLIEAPGLSSRARRALTAVQLEKVALARLKEGRPFTFSYLLNRATSLDWNVLDLFYRLSGFDYFKVMFDLAETGQDEGPVCNLSLVSQLLSRFVDQTQSVLTAHFLRENRMQNQFFGSYLFALFRLGEGEFEDTEDPFPKGRIPFLTVHQAKGLEFPVVVLGSPTRQDRGPGRVEQLVRPFLKGEPEPLEKVSQFDTLRMFYVALSRAQNLMVVA